ncbi:hypothetical protein KY345_02910 [Candidatus Woesearchaeota archaeon]|nr:hypothetical protein [Candidatus Woesearchaeota archaeon]
MHKRIKKVIINLKKAKTIDDYKKQLSEVKEINEEISTLFPGSHLSRFTKLASGNLSTHIEYLERVKEGKIKSSIGKLLGKEAIKALEKADDICHRMKNFFSSLE